MSLIIQRESSLILDCLDRKFSIVVFHDHSCNYCGFTMLFDPSVVSRSPYQGEGTEELPPTIVGTIE